MSVDIANAKPGDIFVDASGKLWRVRATCREPTVDVEEVEGKLAYGGPLNLTPGIEPAAAERRDQRPDVAGLEAHLAAGIRPMTTITTTDGRAMADFLFLGHGGEAAIRSAIASAEAALHDAQMNLLAIRELRHLTGNPMDDWCRGRDAYQRRASAGLDRCRRCRAAVVRWERKLAWWIAEKKQLAGRTTPVLRERRAAA